jgi:hypothetical protein
MRKGKQVGRHELRPERRANLTKVAGVAGMAAAAATLAMTVGSGTASAKPGDGLRKILHPSSSDSGSPSATKAASTSSSKTSVSSIFNNGGLHIGKVVSPTPGIIVKNPDPANNKPWPQITGIQLPVWTVDGNGTAHAPF